MIDMKRLAGTIAAGLLLAAGVLAPVHARTDASTLSITELAAIDLVNSYLNDIRTLQGNFVQTAPDGRVSQGRFFIEKPGRLRFEYAAPARTQVIADGFWVAVQDRQLNTTERYPLRTTPLRMLLADRIDLMREARIVDVSTSGEAIELTLEESGGEAVGSLTLHFDPVENRLRRWIVTDAQGLDTTVDLEDIVAGQPIDRARFRIVEDHIVDHNSRR